jgi:hypothetical protein
MKILFRLSVIAVLLPATGCKHSPEPQPFSRKDISHVLDQMTDLMVHDVTNPPLAARFFSYACLAGYEILSENDNRFKSMHGVINDYPDLRKPDSISGYAYQLAALLAMMKTAGKMEPSGNLFGQYERRFLDSCRGAGYSDEIIESSQKYALAISKRILAYAKADGYNKISNLPRYTPEDKEGCWYPTPPAYMAAVEPWFKTVRPFTLDSSSQFKPAPPIPFSKDKQGAFYKLMMQNYNDTLPQEHRIIAAFWDCNPFAVQDNGHLWIGLKKISPGAHWLGITGIACELAGKSFEQSMMIYTLVAIGLMDSFICCWDEKYRSNRVRPETAIRKYIDRNWSPLLQTPPFPEYLSGHSCISSTSATILTWYFGDHFHYTDSVEVQYGLPPRHFESFQQAALEAGISRFYGGIHFMDAIGNGRLQGLQVGEHLLKKVHMSKDK